MVHGRQPRDHRASDAGGGAVRRPRGAHARGLDGDAVRSRAAALLHLQVRCRRRPGAAARHPVAVGPCRVRAANLGAALPDPPCLGQRQEPEGGDGRLQDLPRSSGSVFRRDQAGPRSRPATAGRGAGRRAGHVLPGQDGYQLSLPAVEHGWQAHGVGRGTGKPSGCSRTCWRRIQITCGPRWLRRGWNTSSASTCPGARAG